MNGTSMATPFVSALVALTIAAGPKSTPSQIRLRLDLRGDRHRSAGPGQLLRLGKDQPEWPAHHTREIRPVSGGPIPKFSPMTAIGADPEALRDLSRQFRKLTVRLESSRTELDRHLRNANGTDRTLNASDKLVVQHRVGLLRTAELCRVSSAALLNQADDQEKASKETGGHISGGRPGGSPGAWPGGWPSITGALPPPASEAVDFPESITELDAGVSVTVASILLGLGHDIRIEDFANGRSMITVTNETQGGAKASIGASVVGELRLSGRARGKRLCPSVAGWHRQAKL